MAALPLKERLGNVLLAAATFVGMSCAHAAVINGTFDTFVPSNGTGGGWTSVNIDGNGGWRATGGNPSTGPYFILNDAGQLATDPTISQTLTGLNPGSIYQVTGDFRTVYIGQNTGSTQAFGVFIDGVAGFESPGIQDTAFHSFSFNFAASASSALLSLAGERNGTDNDFGIDNIAVALVGAPPGALPEPGTALLLLGGLATLATGRVKRRST